jgi:hypothetical protein
VLQAGLNMHAHPEPVGSFIIINDVYISTDPNQWSPLTVKEMMKLELNAENKAEFERKDKASIHDPNAAYRGTKFRSPYQGANNKKYVFWVKHLRLSGQATPAYKYFIHVLTLVILYASDLRHIGTRIQLYSLNTYVYTFYRRDSL